MLREYYSDDQVTLYHGDCRPLLAELDAASVDAIVTDPPYDLTSGNRNSGAGGGFMGKAWDATGVAFDPATWRECLRVLKPGGWLLAFGGTRTWHRLACAIEDAGFEIRDSVADLTGRDGPGLLWIHGQGFPKSLNVSKAIDDAAGAAREVIGEGQRYGRGARSNRSRVEQGYRKTEVAPDGGVPSITAPSTDEAAQWSGWGTALKPAWEPIVVGRKPLAGTVVQNVLEHGTGALNIAACLVEHANPDDLAASRAKKPGRRDTTTSDVYGDNRPQQRVNAAGRWPTNMVLAHTPDCEPVGTADVRSDGHHPATRGPGGLSTSGHKGQDGLAERKSGTEVVDVWDCAPGCPVAEMDAQSGQTSSWMARSNYRIGTDEQIFGKRGPKPVGPQNQYGDTGGASRFFPVFRYQAKAGADERPRLADGTTHPTVKPLKLIEWLVRLVTPPGGLVLDLFAGSGTTGEACIIHGFPCVLIEQDERSCELIRTRLSKPIQPDLFGGAA